MGLNKAERGWKGDLWGREDWWRGFEEATNSLFKIAKNRSKISKRDSNVERFMKHAHYDTSYLMATDKKDELKEYYKKFPGVLVPQIGQP